MNSVSEQNAVIGSPRQIVSSLHDGTSAVSWGAIFAGGAAAAAFSLILLLLGAGLGLSLVSPWVREGIGATTFGISTIIWVVFMQLFAFGMGGYITGRLRAKWIEVDRDEVYFRDTAHGFLSWAIACLVSAVLLTSAITSIITGGVKAGASAAGAVVSSVMLGSDAVKPSGHGGPLDYYVDLLFRKDLDAVTVTAPPPAPGNAPIVEIAPEQTNSPPTSEIARIFLKNIQAESLPPEDVRYLGQVVALRTGITQPEAEKRVTDTYVRMQAALHNAETTAKEAVDKTRKASSYAALWLFISLLIGAFSASWAATCGGRQRDAY